MHISYFMRFVLLVLCVLPLSSFAQNSLDRISRVERSDGKGFVVRYHLSEKVDSFMVNQPSADLIQMALYHPNLDTNGIILPDVGENFKEVILYKMNNGFGIDVYLNETASVTSKAYPDQNGKHVLLSLTHTEPETVSKLIENIEAINWYEIINPGGLLESTPSELLDRALVNEPNGNYDRVRDKLRFDKVVIDAGHGDWEPGSIGYKGVKEKDIALAVSLKLGEYINQYLPDVEVIYTRKNDTFKELQERGQFANKIEGDLFISIHANAFTNTNVRGTEVYFLGLHRSNESLNVMKRENSVFKNEGTIELTEQDLLVYELANSGYIASSEKIATMIDYQFTQRAGRKSRGVKQAGFQVLYEASMPAVLIELGFITNPSEQRFLTSDYGQSIMASAIFRAVRDYKLEHDRIHAYSTSK